MKLEEAIKCLETKTAPIDATPGELLQLAMGACLTDEGDIICLSCLRPNECCECTTFLP